MRRKKQSVHHYYDNLLEKEVKPALRKEDDDYILNTDTEDLVDYYLNEYSLQPPELHADKEESLSFKREERTVPANQREDIYQGRGDKEFEYKILTLNFPLKQNSDIGKITQLRPPKTFISGETEKFQWSDKSIDFELEVKGYGFEWSESKIESEIERHREILKKFVRSYREKIEEENEKLERSIREFIESRKENLEEDNEKLKNISDAVDISLEKKKK